MGQRNNMLVINGVSFDLDAISSLCSRAGVMRAYLFGSILTDRFTPQSDVDILVETDADHRPGMLALGGLQMDLSELVGRTVHLSMLSGVPMEDRRRLLSGARVLDAA